MVRPREHDPLHPPVLRGVTNALLHDRFTRGWECHTQARLPLLRSALRPRSSPLACHTTIPAVELLNGKGGSLPPPIRETDAKTERLKRSTANPTSKMRRYHWKPCEHTCLYLVKMHRKILQRHVYSLRHTVLLRSQELLANVARTQAPLQGRRA